MSRTPTCVWLTTTGVRSVKPTSGKNNNLKDTDMTTNHPYHTLLTQHQQNQLREAVANKPNETMAQTIEKLDQAIARLQAQAPEKFK